MKAKPGVNFIMTTVIGGLIFLVPLMFLVFILGKAVGFMMVIAKPLAAWLPVDTVSGVALANLIAILAVIIVSFVAGLIARHTIAGNLMKILETKVLINIPGYTMIKAIKSGFDATETEGIKPVALKLGSAERIALEIEKLPDGRSMVYIPSVPSSWSGISPASKNSQGTIPRSTCTWLRPMHCRTSLERPLHPEEFPTLRQASTRHAPSRRSILTLTPLVSTVLHKKSPQRGLFMFLGGLLSSCPGPHTQPSSQ